MGKLKHRTFNADRFLDKFQGQEAILRNFVGLWDGRLGLDAASLDVPRFKEFLVDGDGDARTICSKASTWPLTSVPSEAMKTSWPLATNADTHRTAMEIYQSNV